MPETTDESMLNALRYQQNKEVNMIEREDATLLEEIADFIMAAAPQFKNPSLMEAMRDVANQIVLNKDTLAKAAPAQQEQMAAGGQAPMPPPGMVEGGAMPPQPPAGMY